MLSLPESMSAPRGRSSTHSKRRIDPIGSQDEQARMNVSKSLAGLLVLSALPFAIGCGDGGEEKSSNDLAWVGHTYLLQTTAGNWVEPSGIGGDIAPYVPRFLIQVESGSGNSMNLVLGAATAAGAQEMCNPTTSATATVSYPDSVIGPVDFPAYLVNPADEHNATDIITNPVIADLTLTNVLPDGDTPAEAGLINAVMDARQVAKMFTQLGDNPTEETVCTAVQSYAPCVACRDGLPWCLPLKATRVGATEVNLGLTPITGTPCGG